MYPFPTIMYGTAHQQLRMLCCILTLYVFSSKCTPLINYMYLYGFNEGKKLQDHGVEKKFIKVVQASVMLEEGSTIWFAAVEELNRGALSRLYCTRSL